MKPFKMALPRTVEEASKASEGSFDRAELLAGGTDLLGELKSGIRTPEVVVNLKRIPGLDSIEMTDAGLMIGALARLSDVAAHESVQKSWPALAQTIGKTATPQIRNVATFGGNLCQRVRCWYYRDDSYPCLKKGGTFCYAQQGENEYHSVFNNYVCCAPNPSNVAPVVVAYDAKIEIKSGGKTKLVDAEDFFIRPERDVTRETILDPGDVVTRVLLPTTGATRHSSYVESREKQSFDWALCGTAVALELDGKKITRARVVLGAVAPTPLRRPDLEKLLVGQTVDDALIARLQKTAVRGARPLAQNKFKLDLVKATVKRALTTALKG